MLRCRFFVVRRIVNYALTKYRVNSDQFLAASLIKKSTLIEIKNFGQVASSK